MTTQIYSTMVGLILLLSTPSNALANRSPKLSDCGMRLTRIPSIGNDQATLSDPTVDVSVASTATGSNKDRYHKIKVTLGAPPRANKSLDHYEVYFKEGTLADNSGPLDASYRKLGDMKKQEDKRDFTIDSRIANAAGRTYTFRVKAVSTLVGQSSAGNNGVAYTVPDRVESFTFVANSSGTTYKTGQGFQHPEFLNADSVPYTDAEFTASARLGKLNKDKQMDFDSMRTVQLSTITPNLGYNAVYEGTGVFNPSNELSSNITALRYSTQTLAGGGVLVSVEWKMLSGKKIKAKFQQAAGQSFPNNKITIPFKVN